VAPACRAENGLGHGYKKKKNNTKTLWIHSVILLNRCTISSVLDQGPRSLKAMNFTLEKASILEGGDPS
jgi:hypothetical protein